MKKILPGIMGLLFSFNTIASTPTEVLTPINNIYTPKGFDSNDNAEVVLTGYLPNLCHKSPKTRVEIDGNTINVTVTSLKYTASNPYCNQVLVPFLKTLDLGILEKGKYEIVVNGESTHQHKRILSIAPHHAGSIDEYIYPAVEFIEKNHHNNTIRITGYNPSDCFVLDRIEVVDNSVDTYSVLPVLKRVNDFCPLKMTPFSYEMEVPTEIDRSLVLLHIRSMNGNSINTLFDYTLK